MRPDLDDALRRYAGTLQREQPSSALDLRVARSIQAWAGSHRQRRAARVFEFRLFAAAAAGALLMIGAAYVAFVRGPEDGAPMSAAQETTALATDVPADAVVPLDAVVLRVPTAFAGGATAIPAVATARDELRFWVDVRIASDGSMRVVRVVPVDAGGYAQ